MTAITVVARTPTDSYFIAQPVANNASPATTAASSIGDGYFTPIPIANAISPPTLVVRYFKQFCKSDTGAAGWIPNSIPATKWLTPTLSYARYLPVWAIDYRGWFVNTGKTLVVTNFNQGYTIPTVGIPITGSISGQVQEQTIPVAGRLVKLYYKPTGDIIASTYSDINGNYSFAGLEPNATKYVVAAYNNIPLQYDAVIHDNITAL